MLANLIHELSVRRDAQFVDLNCAGLSANLLEMELFGYERGAFTDARQRKRGLFEIADGGTVFLDEVADMPPEVQARLLKVIEDRTFRRLGGTQVVETDVRVIAATNADLDVEVAAGRFRPDLYYRINVMPIELPPLRERRDQIPLLAARFLSEFGRRLDKPITGYSREVLGILTNYPWPGNIRELRNIIERSVLLCDQGEIGVQHLKGGLRIAKAAPAIVPESAVADVSLAEVEAAHIRSVLANNGGRLTEAAKILGINRSTLRAKMKKYGIQK